MDTLQYHRQHVQPSLYPPPPDYDPCARGGAAVPTSIDAHRSILPGKRAIHERIVALAQARGEDGITVHDVAAALESEPHRVSGRLTELRALGRLVYRLDADGERTRRRGAYVLVAAGGEKSDRGAGEAAPTTTTEGR